MASLPFGSTPLRCACSYCPMPSRQQERRDPKSSAHALPARPPWQQERTTFRMLSTGADRSSPRVLAPALFRAALCLHSDGANRSTQRSAVMGRRGPGTLRSSAACHTLEGAADSMAASVAGRRVSDQLRPSASWGVRALAPAGHLGQARLHDPAERVRPRFKLPHWGTIVISANARVGRQVTIHPDTLIGERGGSPRIGDRVYVGAGAKAYGSIVVGDDEYLAPNCVVTRSVRARGADARRTSASAHETRPRTAVMAPHRVLRVRTVPPT